MLWFYLSAPWPGKIEFTTNETGAPEPALATLINGPAKSGIYPIRLSDYHVILKSAVEYEWFLAIVQDPQERSGDFLASATIKYIPPAQTVSQQLQSVATDKSYYVYAKEGYWYDSIAKICSLIGEKPDDPIFKAHRAALLKQVGLSKAAAP